jgi:6-phospho-beta-glucosidase
MKISIIGGGGTRVPILVGALLEAQALLKLTEISLIDPDVQRTAAIAKVLKAMVQEKKSEVKISYPTTFRKCVEQASFIFLAIRVGGDHLRTLDERIPLALNLIGQETVGAGGFAMAVRTIPVISEMLKEIQAVAPEAWCINLTNPSGILTQAMLTSDNFQKVVGICDAPTLLGTFIAYLLKIKKEALILDYYGLNHCGFVKAAYVAGQDVLPLALSQIEQAPGWEARTHFSPTFIKHLRQLPNEYIWYYRFKEAALAIIKAAKKTRGETVEATNSKLVAELLTTEKPLAVYNEYLSTRANGHLAEKYRVSMGLTNAGGYSTVAMEVLLALAGKKAAVVPVNVANKGAIAGLAFDDVVEVPALITEKLIRPLAVGLIEPEAEALLEQVKTYERALVAAIQSQSLEALTAALALNPLVPSLALARELVTAFKQQEAPYFDNFK